MGGLEKQKTETAPAGAPAADVSPEKNEISTTGGAASVNEQTDLARFQALGKQVQESHEKASGQIKASTSEIERATLAQTRAEEKLATLTRDEGQIITNCREQIGNLVILKGEQEAQQALGLNDEQWKKAIADLKANDPDALALREYVSGDPTQDPTCLKFKINTALKIRDNQSALYVVNSDPRVNVLNERGLTSLVQLEFHQGQERVGKVSDSNWLMRMFRGQISKEEYTAAIAVAERNVDTTMVAAITDVKTRLANHSGVLSAESQTIAGAKQAIEKAETAKADAEAELSKQVQKTIETFGVIGDNDAVKVSAQQIAAALQEIKDPELRQAAVLGMTLGKNNATALVSQIAVPQGNDLEASVKASMEKLPAEYAETVRRINGVVVAADEKGTLEAASKLRTHLDDLAKLEKSTRAQEVQDTIAAFAKLDAERMTPAQIVTELNKIPATETERRQAALLTIVFGEKTAKEYVSQIPLATADAATIKTGVEAFIKNTEGNRTRIETFVRNLHTVVNAADEKTATEATNQLLVQLRSQAEKPNEGQAQNTAPDTKSENKPSIQKVSTKVATTPTAPQAAEVIHITTNKDRELAARAIAKSIVEDPTISVVGGNVERETSELLKDAKAYMKFTDPKGKYRATREESERWQDDKTTAKLDRVAAALKGKVTNSEDVETIAKIVNAAQAREEEIRTKRQHQGGYEIRIPFMQFHVKEGGGFGVSVGARNGRDVLPGFRKVDTDATHADANLSWMQTGQEGSITDSMKVRKAIADKVLDAVYGGRAANDAFDYKNYLESNQQSKRWKIQERAEKAGNLQGLNETVDFLVTGQLPKHLPESRVAEALKIVNDAEKHNKTTERTAEIHAGALALGVGTQAATAKRWPGIAGIGAGITDHFEAVVHKREMYSTVMPAGTKDSTVSANNGADPAVTKPAAATISTSSAVKGTGRTAKPTANAPVESQPDTTPEPVQTAPAQTTTVKHGQIFNGKGTRVVSSRPAPASQTTPSTDTADTTESQPVTAQTAPARSEPIAKLAPTQSAPAETKAPTTAAPAKTADTTPSATRQLQQDRMPYPKGAALGVMEKTKDATKLDQAVSQNLAVRGGHSPAAIEAIKTEARNYMKAWPNNQEGMDQAIATAIKNVHEIEAREPKDPTPDGDIGLDVEVSAAFYHNSEYPRASVPQQATPARSSKTLQLNSGRLIRRPHAFQ